MSDINKLSFLSGQLDAKKSELTSLLSKKKLDAEKSKFEKGTYNAYIEKHRGAKFPPLSEEEIYSLVKNLDGLAAASKEEYTDAVCGSAELGVSSDDLCREYHDLERALYVAEKPNVCVRIINLMHGLFSSEVQVHSCLSVTAKIIDIYRNDDEYTDASHNKQALEMTKALRRFVSVILSKLDSVRAQLDSDVYYKLCDHYEKLDIILGQSADWFKTYSGEPLKRTVFLRDHAGAQLDAGYDSFVFYDRVVNGKYDSWQKECCASVVVQHFYLPGDDKKTDTAELALLLDENGSHYTKRLSVELEECLKKEGCLDGNGRFSGALGEKLSKIEATLKIKNEKPVTKSGRVILASIICLALAALMWVIAPIGKDWLSTINMMQLPVIVIPAFVTGFIAFGKRAAFRSLGIGIIVFLANIFLAQLLGFDSATHNRVFMTIAMGICTYRYISLMLKIHRRQREVYLSRERQRRDEARPEIELAEGYVKRILTAAEKTCSAPVIAYYKAALEHISKQRAQL